MGAYDKFCAVICHNYINNTKYAKQFPTNVTLLLSADAKFYD